MEPSEKFKQDNPLDYAAWEMSQIFDNFADEEGTVTGEGLFWLGEVFGRVAVEDRSEVFIRFLSLLDSKGYDVDPSQFLVDPDNMPKAPTIN